ncbi:MULTISPECIES: 3-isopropylmalate dehydrogenase [Bacillus cereus group]|uniref:3-isopropylmalate dehydrogenase n=1 Tax=Bacillus cereus group TaxID=86661 RepID=UPI0008FE52E4|nr:3-isopropylmalate dehydrogenase [Bacillus thuringiensis]OJE25861.1 3-isopropylmalate dehydrogenase [Bacillus thuringiensis]PGP44512.1 3-isopropylmalate dehydrogenase [Bacillus thuringiensis]
MEKRIVCLAGDGVGPEVMESAKEVLHMVERLYGHHFHLQDEYFGGVAIDLTGQPLPQRTLAACLASDAVLLGAVGGPRWDSAKERPEKGLLALRKGLGVFANVRPVTVESATAHLSPLKNADEIDFVVVRELTGGIYFSYPKERTEEVATDTLTYHRHEIERIVSYAFQLANKRKKKVTSIDKANVLESSKLWRDVTEEVALRYPNVEVEHILVDAAAMELIRNPGRFDVIVTENLFGDILSDEASVLAGSLGMLPSASHAEKGPSLYEPIHGSAPDIAGKNKANPIAMMRSVAMMLGQSFGLTREGYAIEEAVSAVLKSGKCTADIGGTETTTSFTKAVIQEMEEQALVGRGR